MKWLFERANAYVQACDWKDLALIKFCLCAMGVMLGFCVRPRAKKPAAAVAAVVFLATYIPLMAKFFPILLGKKDEAF